MYEFGIVEKKIERIGRVRCKYDIDRIFRSIPAFVRRNKWNLNGSETENPFVQVTSKINHFSYYNFFKRLTK